MRIARLMVASLLVLEGLSTGVATVTRLPSALIYPAATLVMLGLRALVGVVQFAGGWMLLRGQPPGVFFSRIALLSSAALLTLELGFDLAPGSLFHSWRWPVVIAYWVYAVVMLALLGARTSPSRTSS